MEKANRIPNDAMILGLLMIVSNRMDTLLERELKEFGVTAKQWFLSETIHSLFSLPPTLKEVAGAMGSSHQNVKQVALLLERKGLLSLVKDKRDARVTRLVLTERSRDFWMKTDPKGTEFRNKVFKDINPDDLAKARQVFEKMQSNLAEIEMASVETEEPDETPTRCE